MSTDFYTRWELDRSSQNFKARTHKMRAVGNMVITYLQPQSPECTFESYYSTGKQKKIDCFCLDVFCAHYNTVFEAKGCCFHFLRMERSPSKPLGGGNAERNQKREHDEIRRETRDTKLLKSGSVIGGNVLKKRKMSEIKLGRTFPSNCL